MTKGTRDIKKRSNAEKLGLFERFFTGLAHVHGSIDPRSDRPIQVKQPVTDRVILAHLTGRRRYGVYLLVEDTTRAVVADFDDEDCQGPALFVKDALKNGIPSYIERSKSKGFHVWSFFEPPGVSAWKARIVFRHILEEIQRPETEVFPKQDSLGQNIAYGNFIFVPLFGADVKADRTVFLEPETFKPYRNQWDFLEYMAERISESLLDQIIKSNGLLQKPAPVPRIDTPYPGIDPTDRTYGLPPCATKMLEGVTSNQRVICFRLAVHLKNVGLPLDMVVEVLNLWAARNRPINKTRIITPEEISSQAMSAFEKGYRGCGLEDPIIQPFCHTECPIRRSLKKKQEDYENSKHEEVRNEK